MISPNEIKNGLVIKLDGQLFSVMHFQHIKPGKGGSFVRTRLRNLKAGTVIERTFRETDEIEEAFIDEMKLQYLYQSEGLYYFMDNETFEQLHIDRQKLGDALNYLKENLELSIYTHDGEIVSVILPSSVELKVTHTEQGIKGDTAKSGNKPAVVETGVKVLVPLFIENGDIIRVDTRTGEYLGRV